MPGSLELVPLLQIQRDLYELPPGRERFERYLEVMTDGRRGRPGPDMELPLSLFNPMAKPHAAERLDALIVLGAEEIAREALREASHRLPESESSLRVSLVLVDDLRGGWTHRQLTELSALRDPSAELRRGWATVLLWSAEGIDGSGLRRRVLATAFRARHALRHGPARRLGDLMTQEGAARLFAGELPPIDLVTAERYRSVIDPHRSSEHLPVLYSCLYGDEAAAIVGYDPVGLPADAGWHLALHESHAKDRPPEDALGPSQAGPSIR